MTIKEAVNSIRLKWDLISPYPSLYSFIMSENEKSIFDKAIKGASHYLEYGMGGSTLRALLKSKAIVYSVESSPEWVEHMRKYVKIRLCENTRLRIFLVNIGPLRRWGYPQSDAFRDTFELYSSGVFNSITSSLIDLVLVDGRFRVACVLKTIMECHGNMGVRIMIHDFWNRPQYHVLTNYLDVIERADTLGLFSIKKCIDLASIADEYKKYKFVPE